MNILSSLLNFIADKIGTTSMGTTATTLTGAIAEVRKRTRNVYNKGTYSSQTLRGVTGYTGVSSQVFLTVPISVASDVSSVSVTSLKVSIRTIDGYLGGGGGLDLTSYITTASLANERQPLLYIVIQNSNLSFTVHTPVAGQVEMSFTLS